MHVDDVDDGEGTAEGNNDDDDSNEEEKEDDEYDVSDDDDDNDDDNIKVKYLELLIVNLVMRALAEH